MRKVDPASSTAKQVWNSLVRRLTLVHEFALTWWKRQGEEFCGAMQGAMPAN
jgi:hypothetical protein